MAEGEGFEPKSIDPPTNRTDCSDLANESVGWTVGPRRISVLSVGLVV